MTDKDQVFNHFAESTPEELFAELQTSDEGLSHQEVLARLKEYGKNILEKGEKKTALKTLIAQAKDWLILTLVIASIISFALGDHLNALVILALVILSIILGFSQEYRAEKALESLASYISKKSRVKRDGEWAEVNSEELVVGDVVEMRIGDVVPADLRLIELDGLMANEAVLTGESLPIAKTTDEIKGYQPQQLKNMVFMGTAIAEGHGKGIVVATGSSTFMGKTASLLAIQPDESEFQKQTKQFSKFLFKIIFLMTLFVFLVNAGLNKGVLDSFLFALAIAVGVTPELLPAIITITLSQGALKIAKKKVIVKRLRSVEDLGNINTLCTDKTGTLTKGEFSLTDYQTVSGEKDESLILKAVLCVSGELIGDQTLTTNPIDRALWDSKEADTAKKKLKAYQLLDENEFDYSRRRMSVLVRDAECTSLIVKGSVESMVEVSRLTQAQKKQILDKTYDWEQHGHRVIGIGEKLLEKDDSSSHDEKEIEFLGFLLFSDPIKSSAQKLLERLRGLGVDIKVLSGDSAAVTEYVTNQVGFDIRAEDIKTGADLEGLSKKEFAKVVAETTVFARITPEQKYNIVKALNDADHVVGFLGDGVNDAPALKAADVGIAVDSGAMVAKEAADIILLRKDLMVLADGIEAGRHTFGNIMKYILNTISANYGNMFTVSLSSLFLKFIPLLPSQILLNNFISDIPLFAVATDNVDKDFVREPKKWNLRTIGHFMLYFGLISSVFDLAMILPMAFYWKVSPDVFRTAWFIESSLSEIIVTFSIRTRLPFYKSVPGRLLIIFSVLASFAILGLPLVGFGQSLFEFANLPSHIWLWTGSVVLGYFAVVEVTKHWFFKRFSI